MFYVKKHLHSDEINKFGLANILLGYVVKDINSPQMHLQMATQLLNPYVGSYTPIEQAFTKYISEKGSHFRDL